MMHRVLLLSLLTFACLKDDILAQEDEQTKEEELQLIISIGERFPEWGMEVANNLTMAARGAGELVQYLKDSAKYVKGGNDTAWKDIANHILVYFEVASPLANEILKFGGAARESLDIYNDFASKLNKE
ncbi:uncharacterized protein [Periplaneta americana]|uniref:uncharacterized protein n=1 Tax=Periplaneta americana TaxID=6978 RepID=UPI0037E99CA1